MVRGQVQQIKVWRKIVADIFSHNVIQIGLIQEDPAIPVKKK